MSYTPEDAARDQFFEELEKELYPQHKEQAIEEFTTERLQSFYLKNPKIAASAVWSYKEAKALLEVGHSSASFVFAVSSIEQMLKAVVMKPIVYGLVHKDALADLIVDMSFTRTSLRDYNIFLGKLFENLAGIKLNELQRQGAAKKLLVEAAELQEVRNKVVHSGLQVKDADAKNALAIAEEIFSNILLRMLNALGLGIEKDEKGGTIVLLSKV